MSDIPSVDELFPRDPSLAVAPDTVTPVTVVLDPLVEAPLLRSRISAQPPTRSHDTIKDWSRKYGWPERAAIFDAQQAARQHDEHRAVMGSGIALPHNRVRVLTRIFNLLLSELMVRDKGNNYVNLFLGDAKMIGSGPEAYVVTTRRYNSAMINDVLRVMDDIAKESGGRQSTLESLIRAMPWDRLPDKYAMRMTAENPREVLMAMFDDFAEQVKEHNDQAPADQAQALEGSNDSVPVASARPATA